MKYRYEKDDDGFYTVFDVPIFTECERQLKDGSVTKWSKKDLTTLAKACAAKQKRGIMPPIFVGHNGTRRGDNGPEEALGSLDDIRALADAEFFGDEKYRLVANYKGLDDKTLQKILTHRLPGRSIEVSKDLMRISGLALLGRRPAYHELPQRSLPASYERYEIYEDDEEHYGMNPAPSGAPAPAQAAPAQAAPAQADPMQQVMQLLQQILQRLPQGAPAAAPAAAPAPAAPAAKPANFEAEVEEAPVTPTEAPSDIEIELAKAKARNEYYEAELAKFASVAEVAQEQSKASQREAALADLAASGRVVDLGRFDDMVEKFGLDFAVETVKSTPAAPTPSSTKEMPKAAEVSMPDAPEAVNFELYAPHLRPTAQHAAATWDSLPAHVQADLKFDTKQQYVDAAVRANS